MTDKRGHLDSLDSLRGIAALIVIFSHVFFAYYMELHAGSAAPQASEAALSLFHSPFTFFYRGQFAVLLFFILSGYVLTLGCVKKSFTNPDYIPIAASKRYLRLGIPTAASVLICYLFVVLGLVPVITDGPTPRLMDSPAAAPALSSAMASAVYKSMLFGDQTFNYVLWTIKIEFYGSLLIFAVFALLGRNRGLHMAVCAGLFVYLQSRGIYTNMYSYFFLGALLARVDFESLKRFAPAWLVAALLIPACYLAGYHADSAAYRWLLPLADALGNLAPQANTQVIMVGLGAAGVIIAVLLASSDGVLSAGLRARPILLMGKLSFSVYLLHPIILSSLGKYIYMEMGKTLVSVSLCMVAVTTTTYVLSHFFFRYVDIPSLKLADAFGRALFSTPHRPAPTPAAGDSPLAFKAP